MSHKPAHGHMHHKHAHGGNRGGDAGSWVGSMEDTTEVDQSATTILAQVAEVAASMKVGVHQSHAAPGFRTMNSLTVSSGYWDIRDYTSSNNNS